MEQPDTRRAHSPKVVGSNPAPATNNLLGKRTRINQCVLRLRTICLVGFIPAPSSLATRFNIICDARLVRALLYLKR